MIYNTSLRILTDDKGKQYKLSKLYHRFLICLSLGDVVAYDEAVEQLGTYTSIHKLKYDFCKRVPIKIRTIREVGFILDSDIYFY